MIIVQVTYKVFIDFFHYIKIFSDTNTFSVSTSPKENRSLLTIKFIFFNFHIDRSSNFYTHFYIHAL